MQSFVQFLLFLTIHFHNCVGGSPLRFDQSYINRFGEPFTLHQLKYYISNIRLNEGKTQVTILKEPHLIDYEDSTTLILTLTSPLETISAISFDIGVDSTNNTGPVKTGDLDPMLGMFWTWNTGYIYARLEGESDSAHAPAHRFTWDIGGYKSPMNAKRTVSLPINNEKPITNITITADLLNWFDGSHPIRLSQHPICHQPGDLAMQLADNYSTMFTAVAH